MPHLATTTHVRACVKDGGVDEPSSSLSPSSRSFCCSCFSCRGTSSSSPHRFSHLIRSTHAYHPFAIAIILLLVPLAAVFSPLAAAQSPSFDCTLKASLYASFNDALAGGQNFAVHFTINNTLYLVLPSPLITLLPWSGMVYSFSNGSFALHQHLLTDYRDTTLHLTLAHLKAGPDHHPTNTAAAHGKSNPPPLLRRSLREGRAMPPSSSSFSSSSAKKSSSPHSSHASSPSPSPSPFSSKPFSPTTDQLFLFQCGQSYIHIFSWEATTAQFVLSGVYNDSSVYQYGLCEAFVVDGHVYLLTVNGNSGGSMHSVVLFEVDVASGGLLTFSYAFDWYQFAAVDATDCHVFAIGDETFAAVSKDNHRLKYTLLRWHKALRRFEPYQTLDPSFGVYQSALVEYEGQVYLLAPSEGACRSVLYVWNGSYFDEYDWALDNALGGGAVFFGLSGQQYLAFGQYDHLGAWSVELLALNATGDFNVELEISTGFQSQLFLDILEVPAGPDHTLPLLLFSYLGHPVLYQLSTTCTSPPPPPAQGFFDLYKIMTISFAGAGALVLILAGVTWIYIRRRRAQYEAVGDAAQETLGIN